MNFVNIKNKIIIFFVILALIALLLIWFGRNITYHGAGATMLANELRIRAGIFDEWGNLKPGMQRVDFFPGTSDFCKKYMKSHGNSGHCLFFYADVSEAGSGKVEGAMKSLFSTVCEKDDFCKEKDLKVIEIYLVKKEVGDLEKINLGMTEFGVVRKMNYIPQDGSWNSM